MGDGELVDADPVVAHQQPAAQPLLVGVQAVARRRLRDLAEQGRNVPVVHVAQRPRCATARARNAAAGIRSPAPRTWQMARTARVPPAISGTPTTPSLPMVATSTMDPSSSGGHQRDRRRRAGSTRPRPASPVRRARSSPRARRTWRWRRRRSRSAAGIAPRSRLSVASRRLPAIPKPVTAPGRGAVVPSACADYIRAASGRPTAPTRCQSSGRRVSGSVPTASAPARAHDAGGGGGEGLTSAPRCPPSGSAISPAAVALPHSPRRCHCATRVKVGERALFAGCTPEVAAGPDGRILAVGAGAREAAGPRRRRCTSCRAAPTLASATPTSTWSGWRCPPPASTSPASAPARRRWRGSPPSPAARPADAWIHGTGWCNDDWTDDARALTRAELDAAGDGRPVLLVRRDGHSACLSSAALARRRHLARHARPARRCHRSRRLRRAHGDGARGGVQRGPSRASRRRRTARIRRCARVGAARPGAARASPPCTPWMARGCSAACSACTEIGACPSASSGTCPSSSCGAARRSGSARVSATPGCASGA